MRKAKALRIAGFVGALGASAALITAAVQGTGAYFTDSHNGDDQRLDRPRQGDDHAVGRQAGLHRPAARRLQDDERHLHRGTARSAEDIWLVFPTGGSRCVHRQPGGPEPRRPRSVRPLRTHQHRRCPLHVVQPGQPGYRDHSGDLCPIDANGWGGSNDQPTSPTGHDDGCRSARRRTPSCSPAA